MESDFIMARNMEFNLEIDHSVDEVFDEGVGSSFLALRKIRWNENSPYKLDIRKWFTNSDGSEVAGKGVSFITENGPNGLVKALLKNNYGDTRDVLDSIKTRDDFLYNVKTVLDEMGENSDLIAIKPSGEDSETTFFDPKELMADAE